VVDKSFVVTSRLALGIALCVLGCGNEPSDEPKDSGPVEPVKLELIPGDFVAEDTPLSLLSAGDPVRLSAAPQGGHVIHVAAKVRGMTQQVANLRVRLRHPDTNLIQVEEARDVAWKPVPGEPDLMQPDLASITQVSHVPACPDYDARSIVDTPWKIEIIVTETGGPGTGSVTLGVLPSCLQADPVDEAQCRCECEANYILGKCGATKDDGGVDGNDAG
jgi:hypothetical protein